VHGIKVLMAKNYSHEQLYRSVSVDGEQVHDSLAVARSIRAGREIGASGL
jgi:hypothetical protein